MNVVDSSGWLEYFADGPNAEFFADAIDLKLPRADSLILATARTYNATLWTQDIDFEAMEDVRYKKKT